MWWPVNQSVFIAADEGGLDVSWTSHGDWSVTSGAFTSLSSLTTPYRTIFITSSTSFTTLARTIIITSSSFLTTLSRNLQPSSFLPQELMMTVRDVRFPPSRSELEHSRGN